MTIIETSSLGNASGSCPYCDARSLIAFNWAYALTGHNAQLLALRSHLGARESLKSGQLYRCRECDQAWYLDANEAMATRVPREREPLLLDWSAQILSVTPPFVDRLGAIGSVGGDRYGNGRGTDRIPCSIRWSDETIDDPCLILITDVPPISPTQPRVKLFRDVVDVRATDCALPLDVRCATRSAEEQRMGFAPTPVEDRTGRIFLLNWSADIFEFEGVRGSEIRLTKHRWSTAPLPPIVSEPADRITFVYADRGPYVAALRGRC